MEPLTNISELYTCDPEAVRWNARDLLAFLTWRDARAISELEFQNWFLQLVEDGVIESGLDFSPLYEAVEGHRFRVPAGYGLTLQGMQAILAYTVKAQDEALTQKINAEMGVGHE